MDLNTQVEKLTKEIEEVKQYHRNVVMALQECRLNSSTKNIIIKNLQAEIKELEKKIEKMEQR